MTALGMSGAEKWSVVGVNGEDTSVGDISEVVGGAEVDLELDANGTNGDMDLRCKEGEVNLAFFENGAKEVSGERDLRAVSRVLIGCGELERDRSGMIKSAVGELRAGSIGGKPDETGEEAISSKPAFGRLDSDGSVEGGMER